MSAAANMVKYLVQFGPFKSMQQSYRATLGHKLAKYGLRYDDLYDPLKDEDVAEALNRLPPDVIIARNCRLKRALDLDQKHEYLPDEVQEKQTPFDRYLQETLEEVRAERRERAQLGANAGFSRIYSH